MNGPTTAAEESRTSVLPITLTELALIMFFLVLLLFAHQLTRVKEAAKTEREEREATIQKLRENLAGYAAYEEAAVSLGVEDAEDFRELVKQTSEREQRIQQLETQLAEATTEAAKSEATLRGQIEHYKRRLGKGGLDYPPCWTDAAGREEYIYLVQIREEDLVIEPAWPAHREGDLNLIPNANELIRPSLSTPEFRRLALPILTWSNEQECRHYVRILDQARSKDSFKSKLLTVEDYFYKYLIRETSQHE